MKFNNVALSTVLASAVAPTAVVEAWNMGNPMYFPVRTMSTSIDRILERERMIAQRMFDMVEPRGSSSAIGRYGAPPAVAQRYELIDNNEKFELKIDVPGIAENDIDIKIDDGRLIVEGERIVSSETSRYASRFSKTFSLDKTVDVDKFTANLTNGVLVVSAPKDIAKLEENIRRIPISSSVTNDETPKTIADNTNEAVDNSGAENEESSAAEVTNMANQEDELMTDNEAPDSNDSDTIDLDEAKKN